MTKDAESMPTAKFLERGGTVVFEYPGTVWHPNDGEWRKNEKPSEAFMTIDGWRWRSDGSLCDPDVVNDIDAELARRAFEQKVAEET